MRIPFAQVAVFERGGFGFVKINGGVARVEIFGQECPLGATGETGTAAAAQAGIDDGFDDIGLWHGQGLFVGGVAAAGDVIAIVQQLALCGIGGDIFQKDGTGLLAMDGPR